MLVKRNRITSIVLIFILIIPLFTVFTPEIPEAYAAPLVYTNNDPLQDGIVDLALPATYDKKTANTQMIQAVWCLAANCGVDTIDRGFVEWNVTDLFNTTVVSVMFIYESPRHDANTYTNVTSLMDTRPSITGDPQTLFDAIGDSPYDADGDGNFYYNDQGQDPTFPVVGINQNITLNNQARIDLQASIDAEIEYFALGFTIDVEAGATRVNYILNEGNPAGPTPNPTLRVEYFGGQVCIPESVEILNPSAISEDDTPWVYTEDKFYFFNASYTFFDLLGGNEASIRFSPDGVTDVTITYSYSNDLSGLLSVIDSGDFITTTTGLRNGTAAFYNSATDVLIVVFPIWFTDNSPDAQYVDIELGCTGFGFLDSGEDFHIYNQGGLVERETEGNGTFTSGGDWFEGCVFADGLIQANQTWRKLQHYRNEYALRFYENVSGAWVPEDQFMQTFQHSGGGAEKYGGILDWILTWKVWGFDNSSSTWVRIIQVAMWMGDGDEGANDEWIAVATQVSDHNGVDEDTRFWNAFIEEEPAARFRTWNDIWINKINASSVMGSRVNAYYFGMQSGIWITWQNWRPMLDNATEVMTFIPMEFDDDSTAPARDWDLMKIELELDFVDTSTSSDPYRVCIEDVNINEVKLTDKKVLHSGVNTPIFNAPRVPDMPIGGILAPLYAAILSLGTILTDAISGGLGVLWGMIDDRFPWFTAFWAGLLSGITDLTTLFVTIFGWLSQLFAWGVNFIGLIATPITIIEGAWINIVNATASFAGVAPTDLGIIFIVMFGIIFPLEALGRGDASVMLKVLELTWAVARTFIFLTMRIGKIIIDFILGLNPF